MFDFSLDQDDVRQIEEYLEKKRTLGWNREKIVNHLYHKLVSRAARYSKMSNHIRTKRHLLAQCKPNSWCRKHQETVGSMKRKMDFRIKALAYLWSDEYVQ